MMKTFKTSFHLILITIVFVSFSCIHDKYDERTEETERIEISNLLLYLKDAGKDIDTTASGIYYVIHENGIGEYPQLGDTCSVEYLGYFINGAIFDVSVNHYVDGLWQVIYKETSMINGFEEAIGLLKKGTKATFIIPSKLAYGSAWFDIIPPYTPLLFDINLKDLKSKAVE